MRPVSLPNPPPITASADAKIDWCIRAIQEIARSSRVADPNKVADEFTVANATATRSLDAATASASDVAAVLATFIGDLKQRGSKGAR